MTNDLNEQTYIKYQIQNNRNEIGSNVNKTVTILQTPNK